MGGKTWKVKLTRKLEKRLAKEVGGKVTPASGALFHSKGDVKGTMFLFEHKATLSKKSYTIKVQELAAIETKALKKGMVPCLVFELVSLRGKYAVVPLHVISAIEHESSSGGSKQEVHTQIVEAVEEGRRPSGGVQTRRPTPIPPKLR